MSTAPSNREPEFQRDQAPAGGDGAQQAPLPAARADLLISPQLYMGRVVYVVKDPVSLSYFRLQPAEQYVVRNLDGRTTATELAERVTARYPEQPTTPDDVLRFVRMLHGAGLLLGRNETHASWIRDMRDLRKRKRGIAKVLGFMFLKLPLFDPDRLLEWLYTYTRGVMNGPGLLLGLLVMAAALTVALPELPRIGDLAFPVLGWQNLMMLSAVFLVVKVIHEFGHGLAAKHRGLEVHEMGILLMIIFPMFYVDTTDAWMVPRRRDRLWITAGGVFVEMLFAALATFVWAYTDPGVVNQIAFNTMLAASVTTLLFNANPLLRYDGYYFLMDLLQIPNMRTKATQYTGYLAKRYLLGMGDATAPREAAIHPFLMPIYAAASSVYRWFITLGIIALLWHLLDPYGLEAIGAMLGSFAIFTMIVLPALKLVRFVWSQRARTWRRLATTAGGLAVLLLIAGGLASIPIEQAVEQPGVVLASERQTLYMPAAGKLDRIHVRTGELVHEGEPILEIANEALEDELKNLKVQCKLAELEREAARAEGRPDIVASQTTTLNQLRERIAHVQQRLDDLIVRAPFTGRLRPARRLESMLGITVKPGEEIGVLISQNQRELAMVLPQHDASIVEPGMTVRVRLWGSPWQTHEGVVTRVGREFLQQLPHEALSGTHEGEVDTVARERYKSAPSTPSVLATVSLAGSPDIWPSDGMTGRGKIVIGQSSLFHQTWRSVRQVLSLDWWL